MSLIEELLTDRLEYLIDLSLLLTLAQYEIVEANVGIRFFVPAMVRQLLDSDDDETLQLIERAFSPSLFGSRPRVLNLSLLRFNLRRLQSSDALEYFQEDADEELRAILSQVRPEPRKAEMRHAVSFVREYTASILTRSQRAGQAILMRTRQLPILLRERIAVLELPAKLDRVTDQKGYLMRRLFGFPGGRAAKAFVGMAISLGGLYWLPFGIAGVAFAFLDP